MVKQWKKSLEQSDILSDETAFRGGAIPASGTIPNTDQVGEGVNWTSSTLQYPASSQTIAAESEETINLVSAAGVATEVTLESDGTGGLANIVGIELDGAVFKEFTTSNTHTAALFYPFDSSFGVRVENPDALDASIGVSAEVILR